MHNKLNHSQLHLRHAKNHIVSLNDYTFHCILYVTADISSYTVVMSSRLGL